MRLIVVLAIVINVCAVLGASIKNSNGGDDDWVIVEHSTESAQTMAARPYQQSDCSDAVERRSVATCLARKTVWTWDVLANKCVTAFYTGCNATKNNFVTEAECLRVAKPVCFNIVNRRS
ncbi:kunitz-type serine protease inhibitor A-like [Diabrotica virgifera virgifera]|uniref:BPTI/Kunitz inhibitor domain-containing protein n=1 Tax=Diabrotica virgifera virgifera TaxID=50390 RepID=A0ABM5IAL5_DIAVI|nr:kunitz-type serine protease inhibitor A-like [Diabrotica virgifera virgifera]